jgi:hypothetical protein
MYEVTKSEKKILRRAIDIGLQKDFAAAITEMDAIITKWKDKQADNRATYSALYEAMRDNDKFIARRYDDLTGSRYLNLVCALYTEGSVSDADLDGLREGTIQLIQWFKQQSIAQENGQPPQGL